MDVHGVVGSGKTTLITRLLHETKAHNMGFLLLDYEGEYTRYAEELQAQVLSPGDKMNPLRLALLQPPEGVSWKTHAEWAYMVLARVIEESGWLLTPQMEAVLNKAVRRAVYDKASVRDLPSYIERASRGLPAGRQTEAALNARLTRVTDGPLTEVLDAPDTLGNPLSGRRIINLQPLARQSSMDARITVLVILYRARQTLLGMRPSGKGARFLIVVEEAEDLLAQGYPSARLVEEIIIHGRKRAVGVVIVSHSPLLLGQRIQSIVGNHVVFRLDTHRGALEAANLLGDQSLAQTIRSLPTGHALVKAASNPAAFKVKVSPLVKSDDITSLLESIIRYPYLTTRDRRALLGWDGSRYKRVVDEAKRRGLVEERWVYRGAGRPVKLLQTRGMNPSAPTGTASTTQHR